MKTEILQLLRESGEYISGQEICNRFGVSRTAIWKVMNQLKEEGYAVEAVPNKGYKLTCIPDVLSESEIKSRLHTKWLGQEVLCLLKEDSTNNRVKKMAEQGAEKGLLVIAEEQTAGKGRRGNSWSSPAGTSIFMSVLLRPDFLPEKASMLTLLAAMAVAKGIKEETGLEAKIKWPNDVVVNGKKICGILTEMSAEMDYINHVVVGIGINANMEELPAAIRETATSLLIEKKQLVSRASLLVKVIEHLERYYEIFIETEDLSRLHEEYNSQLVNRNVQVRVLDPKGDYTGYARGINAFGELLVEKDTGGLEKVYAGEVSVRGMYGYV